MYSILLTSHSLIRWFVLAILIYIVSRSYWNWFRNNPYLKFDNSVRIVTTIIAGIQLTLGICLYIASPLVHLFFQNFTKAVHEREIRFFGMEHSSMMFVAIVLIIIGSYKAKGKNTDRKKFKAIAIWFSIALIIILANIPWSFSPLVNRPLFRWF